MDPESDGQAGAEDVAEAPEGDSGQPDASTEAPLSIAEAFAAAKAELAGEPPAGDSEEEAQEPQASAQPEPQSEQQPEPKGEPEKPAVSSLDRIRTLLEQERIAELSAEERGIVNRIRRSFEAEQKAEREYRESYVGLLTEKAVDPEAFAEKMLENDSLYNFFREYGKAHPEVTLENPNPAERVPTPDEVRGELREQYNTALNEVLRDTAREAGVDYDAILKEAGTKLGSAINLLIERGSEARIAREVEKRLAKERDALRIELQTEYASKTIIAPRQIGGGPVGPRAKDGPLTFREAFEAAKEELAAS